MFTLMCALTLSISSQFAMQTLHPARTFRKTKGSLENQILVFRLFSIVPKMATGLTPGCKLPGQILETGSTSDLSVASLVPRVLSATAPLSRNS